MENRIAKLAFSCLATLFLAACSGTPIPGRGNVVQTEASYPMHNQPLMVETGILNSGPQNVSLSDNEEKENIAAQVSGETQQSSTIFEVPLPQNQTQQEEVADTLDSRIDKPPPTNEEINKIPSAPKVGYRAPEFAIMGADGKPFYLCDFDTPILLNFWNSGCKPCRDEMRYLQNVYDDRLDEGLLVLAVNIGQSPTSVESFMEDNHLHIPVLFDVNAVIARQYQVQFLPTSFFIDRDCNIREKVIGSFSSEAAIEKKLVEIMSE
jgi:cytochrome c biogenesis protein CcmG/thiol:disulfide interchange protein DsbE